MPFPLRGQIFELLKEGRWEYVRRVNANGAVMIVAVTEDGELLLVEEYRVPLHARTIGLPAGISGDEGEESTLQSARRELEEETKWYPSTWRKGCTKYRKAAGWLMKTSPCTAFLFRWCMAG